MANRRRMRWLARELETLAEQGVIPGEVPERVRAHYAGRSENAFPVLGVLGAALVGLGVILILAHNWPALPALGRAGIALGGLLGAQALAAFALRREAAGSREAVGWREAAGIVSTLAVVAAAALVGQTYHASSPVGPFLWQCSMLALPLVLVLRSRGGALLALVAGWTALFHDVFSGSVPHRFWLSASAVGAFTAWLHVRATGEPALRDVFLGWAAVSTLLLGATFNAGAHLVAALVLVLATTAAGLYAWGGRRLDGADGGFLAHPALRLGGLAVGALIVTFSIGEAWEIFSEDLDPDATLAGLLPSLVLAVGGGALAFGAARDRLREGQWEDALPCALPLALAGGWAVTRVLGAEAGALAVTLYGLAVGVGAVLAGMREDAARRANLGLLLVGAVVGVRFLDDDWSFVVRGLVFVALGLAFLLLNLNMRRASAEAAG